MSASQTRFGTVAVNFCCNRLGAIGNAWRLSVVVGRKRRRVRACLEILGSIGCGHQTFIILGATQDGEVPSLPTGSTSTSQPLEVGIPVPSVLPPMSRHVGGPYGTKIIPWGILPSVARNRASP